MANESTTIMLVDLSVQLDRQSEFDDFYHDRYIPEFIRAVPEVLTARRYAQKGLSNPAKAHFLTIYQLSADDCMNDIEDAIARSAHREASDQFKLWKQDGLTYFDRGFYSRLKSPISLKENCWKSEWLCIMKWRATSIEEAQAAVSDYVEKRRGPVEGIMSQHSYARMYSEPPQLMTVLEIADEESAVRVGQQLQTGGAQKDIHAFRQSVEGSTSDEGQTAVRLFQRIYAVEREADSIG